jgi:hypothetical protein
LDFPTTLIPEVVVTQILDSGAREQFSTGAVRDIQRGKGRFDLLPYHALERVAKHFENGIAKYGERKWERGIPTHCFANSAMRHLLKKINGFTDEDHAAAATWNLLCLIQTEHWIANGKLPCELDTLPVEK